MQHLFYGSAAAESFGRFNQGRHLIFKEALASGPVSRHGQSWHQVRALHLSTEFDAEYQDCLDDWQNFENSIGALDPKDELVCWLGRDLFCQIALMYLLVRLGDRPRQLSLVCPQEEDIYCFGDIAPAQMNDYLQKREPLQAIHLQQAAIAWHLYCASDPRSLNAVFDGSIDIGARFATALEQHASRFPWHRDSLGVIERSILLALEAGPLAFEGLFKEVSRKTREYGWTDLQVRNLCHRLASARPALLEAESLALSGMLHLTTAGQEVLQGVTKPNLRCGFLGGCDMEASSDWLWNSDLRRIEIHSC